MNPRTPAEVFPPGEFIRDELDARGWTQDDLATIMGRPQTAVNLIINDKRGITPDTATELAGAFGTSPEFWLNLDSAYRLSKVAVPVAEIRRRAELYNSAPVKDVENGGWIKPAQKARWAKFHESRGTVSKSAPSKKGGISPAGRARITARQKAKWAKFHAVKAGARPEMNAGGRSRQERGQFAAAARWAKVRKAKGS